MPVSRSAFLRRTGAAAALGLLPVPAFAQGALTTVRLGATPSDDMTPIVYAQKSGIFRRNGLDVQISRMTSGAAGAAGLLGGVFDFSKGSVTTVLAAHEKNIPFSIVGEAVVNDPKALYAGFLIGKESPLQIGKDFNDQLISVAAIGDIGNIAISLWIDQHGGNAKSVKFVEVPFPAAGAAVEAGRVTAAENSNPNLQVAMDAGKLRLLPVMDVIAPTYLEVAWITTRDISAKHPAMVRAFVRSYKESVTYTNTHRQQTIPLSSEFTGIQPDVIGRMARALAWPTVVPAHIQPVIDATLKFGAITKGFPAGDIIDANAH
jgi:NitT/TauT family transport system substrate-binding protein